MFYTSNEYNAAEGKKLEKHLKEDDLKIKILVVDENGAPFKGAAVQLLEILSATQSKQLYELSDNYVPYKKKKETDEQGHCVFENMHRHSPFPLTYILFRDGVLPKPNFRVRVRAPGYEEAKKEFVNIDKRTIATSAYSMIFWVRGNGLIVGNKNDPKEKIIKLAEKITIPPENLADGIEIKIILKKETKEVSKKPDATQSKEPEKTN